ncbi:hypothetical protein [Clostridium peptidivorans]|uniref:hypothetical protein n=1 Tax=Clostridium peptidivorans TaxID=100174 RepID=UPI0015C98C33|nr:hypothetical protein [Clostridium peptidivorans]
MVNVKNVVDLAAEIAIKEVEKTGKGYMECIDNSIEEACIRLEVTRDEVYKSIGEQ